jgi:hypothetical protein
MTKSTINKLKKDPLKYFFFKLAVFFLLLFTLDFSIGNILKYFYFKQESGMQYRTTYSIEKTTADILIFGSSRANHHYHPDVFENRLNKSYYNVGRDGNFIFYHSAVLKGILKRYTPKLVILDFVNGEFKHDQNSYDRISSLLPYYERHPEIVSIIELKSRFEKIKLLSSIYPYNSSLFTIAAGNTEFNKKRRSDNKGYIPLTKIWNGSIEIDKSYQEYEIDSLKINAYESFIKDCINSKVKLYIICSPYFVKSVNKDYSKALGQEIAIRNGIDFFDFEIDTTFIKDNKYFSDIAHLNDYGARVFSNKVIDQIIDRTIDENDQLTHINP